MDCRRTLLVCACGVRIRIYRIADGKIVEHWMLVDSAVLMQQLGG